MESVGLIKEAVLAIDNREDDILEHRTAKTNTEFLIQKVLSAFAFALENAATENYYSNQTDIPPDSRRLLYCLNNCKYTQTKVVPNIVNKLTDLDQLSLDKVCVFSFLCGEFYLFIYDFYNHRDKLQFCSLALRDIFFASTV